MTINITLGVTGAVERLKDKTGKPYLKPVQGEVERETMFTIPEGVSFTDRISTVLGGLTHTLDPSGKVYWVESDDAMLKVALEEHFGIEPNTPRPSNWGDDTNHGEGS